MSESEVDKRPALIIPGGGMRNSFVSGVLEGLGIDAKEFAAIYTQSSGGPTSAYFALGQGNLTKDIWSKRLTSGRVLGFRALFWTGRPGDVDYLVDVCCSDLELERLRGLDTKIVVSTVKLNDGSEEYHVLNDTNIDDARQMLKATCALPAMVRPVWLNGEGHIDGGVHTLIPITKANRDGHKKLVVILNRPVNMHHTNKMSMVDKLIFPKNEEVRLSFHERAVLYNEAIDELKEMEKRGEAYLMGPDEKLKTERVSRSKRKVRKSFERGVNVGERHSHKLKLFLGIV